MIKVLVVEDERPILRNITKMIEKANSEFKVCYQAENGRDALNIIENNHVEFIMLDVQMPIMTGTEVLEYMNEHKIEIPTIVLSGYQDFDYVRGALRNNAQDYLLKPLKMADLTKVLMQVEEQIWKARSKAKTMIQEEMEHDGGHEYEVALISRGSYQKDESSINENRNERLLERYINHFLEQEMIAENFWLIAGRNSNEYLVVFRKLGNRTEHVLKKLEEDAWHHWKEQEPFVIVLSDKVQYHSTIFDTNVELQEIVKGIIGFKKVEFCTKNLEEIKKENKSFSEQYWEIIKEVYHKKQVLQCMKEQLITVERRYVMKEMMKSLFWNYLGKKEKNYTYQEIEEELEYIIESIANKDELIEKLEQFAFRILYSQDEENQTDKAKLVMDMKNYMDHNYQMAITNQTLSEQFGYVPAHLRSVYRKQYHVSPMDYLQDLRIKKAKQLLKDQNEYTLKEIALQVGYQDALYFSKVFRKIEGVSPSQYRKGEEDEIR